ncbi:MAG TPA: malto-oligosyltrehalose trehalohydrolase [Tepidisphaeraceae bacterium]|nr:malto-oligosyltrehalose trehalohydrolase [Tepidisphaeraceae bacterium]
MAENDTEKTQQSDSPETTPARRCGATVLPDGTIRWRLWAPAAKNVELVLFDERGLRTTRPMRRERSAEGDGYFTHEEPNGAENQRYAFSLDGGADRPDPYSLWQPDGLRGPSAVVRTESFTWTDDGWRGIARQDLVIYEVHVGTFTPEGTFDAIIPRLADLKDLGITAIEIMPVAQFPGSRNWGYDGVLPFATQNTYGGPRGLQRLVDAAHAAGIAVVLDVVYNHFGPEDNYIHEFGPYFTEKYKTPWGKAVNYDDAGSDAVRDLVLDNVRTWLADFHLDGLRLDAVHAIYDLGARHILRSIREAADGVSQQGGPQGGRQIHIIAESDQNDPRLVADAERGGHGIDAQWSDDFHHAVHALLTGERRGYYSEYGDPAQVARALENPFVFAWQYSPHRKRKHGAPLSPETPGDHFVVCIQNHDQVGNRARGDRLSELLGSPAKQRLASSLLLLSPYLPLLFMGEEYGETRPFPFFCSFCGPELVQAVREGRKREFSDFLTASESIPDPDAADTFASAKLSWSWPDGSFHAGLRHLYRDLLAARRAWPAMRDYRRRPTRLLPSPDRPAVVELLRGDALHAYFNLTDQRQPLPQRMPDEHMFLFCSESVGYGGARQQSDSVGELLPYECVVLGPTEWRLRR